MDDLSELFWSHFCNILPSIFELFKGLYDGLGHPAVSFLGATNDREFFAGRYPFMAVLVVKAEAQQSGNFWRFSV